MIVPSTNKNVYGQKKKSLWATCVQDIFCFLVIVRNHQGWCALLLLHDHKPDFELNSLSKHEMGICPEIQNVY